MDDLLAAHDWKALVEHLYMVLDRHRCREAADWIRLHIKEGHVPIIYMYLRNGTKNIGLRVMSSREMDHWLQTWVFFVLRCVEDVVTYTKVMGKNAGKDVIMLIQKTLGWLQSNDNVYEWAPPGEIVGKVKDGEQSFGPPTWLPSFALASLGNTVYFNSPEGGVLMACKHNAEHFSKTQGEIRKDLLERLEGAKDWDHFLSIVYRYLRDQTD